MKHFLNWLGVAIVIFICTSCASHEGNFLLTNSGKELITRASVTICNQTNDFHDIPSGKRVAGTYKVTSDSHFVVEVEFSSGRKLRKEDGYVTNGIDFRHEIIVTESGIQVASRTL
jgi:hypothetical protein